MRKVTQLLLTILLIMSLVGCQKQEEPTNELHLTKEEWPVVDGATAFLPFYTAMTMEILNVSKEEAGSLILCSTTDYAYPYLINKQVDMIFAYGPSEDQIQLAKSENVELEGLPILNDGFVFFVNKSNPVDSLTIEQLHDIYAGKITNWKEVGGNDEEIIPYQRTEGSGSQTGLYKYVISPEETMDPVGASLTVASMVGIVEKVSNYDNAENALGYSYYYFVTEQNYEEQIKVLKINGIEASKQTIADGSYPMINTAYVIYRKDEAENSVVRKIAKYCQSEKAIEILNANKYIETSQKDAADLTK